MQAIVTGGTGYIGSHLTERPLDDGRRVCVIDDCSTGRLKNLDHLSGRGGFDVHVGNLNDTGLLETLNAYAAWVFHLVALADIVPSEAMDPEVSVPA